jgi:hypothetical protein
MPIRTINRIDLVYGSVDGPGVAWKTISYSSYSSDRFATSPIKRASKIVWREEDFEHSRLISDCDLALHDLKSWKGLSGMSVQLVSLATVDMRLG